MPLIRLIVELLSWYLYLIMFFIHTSINYIFINKLFLVISDFHPLLASLEQKFISQLIFLTADVSTYTASSLGGLRTPWFQSNLLNVWTSLCHCSVYLSLCPAWWSINSWIYKDILKVSFFMFHPSFEQDLFLLLSSKAPVLKSQLFYSVCLKRDIWKFKFSQVGNPLPEVVRISHVQNQLGFASFIKNIS